MVDIFKSILASAFLLFERLKGSKRLTPLPTTPEDELTIKAKSIFGYTVEIYVKRVIYNCEYSSKFFRHKQFFTFEVSSKVDTTAPENVREAFKGSYTFPKMLPTFVPLRHHMDRAINSYVDMVIRSNIKDV